MIAKHIDRFPLLKLDRVIDWQPIEQYLNRQKNRYLRDHRGRPAYPCCPCSKPSCPDNGTASPIPNSNTASSPASISTCFAVDELSIPDYSTLCRYRNWLAQDDTLSELLEL
ncbi:transposase, IS4 family, partial [Neisseria meningitidis 2000080]